MASKWASKFKKGKKQWKDVQKNYNDRFAGSTIEDGVYIGRIKKYETIENNDKLRISRKFVILEGDAKGIVVSDSIDPMHKVGGSIFLMFNNFKPAHAEA